MINTRYPKTLLDLHDHFQSSNSSWGFIKYILASTLTISTIWEHMEKQLNDSLKIE